MCEAPVIRFADHGTMPAVRLTLIARTSGSHTTLRWLVVEGDPSGRSVSVSLLDTCGRRIDVLARTPMAPPTPGEIATDGRLAVVAQAGLETAATESLISGGEFLERGRAN
jgi:hypothetical protein